jgi:hypothetical protein
MITGAAEQVATGLREALTATGADALNLRVHAPGLDPDEVTDQIRALRGVTRLLRS